ESAEEDPLPDAEWPRESIPVAERQHPEGDPERDEEVDRGKPLVGSIAKGRGHSAAEQQRHAGSEVDVDRETNYGVDPVSRHRIRSTSLLGQLNAGEVTRVPQLEPENPGD